jgi:ribosomal protein S10
MASPNAQAPLPDDFSRESIELVLQRLEGWKPEHRQEPTEDEMTFAKKQIEWLEKVCHFAPCRGSDVELDHLVKAMYELRGSDQLWIRTLSRLAATCRRSIQAPDSLSPLKEELTLAEKAHAFGGTAEVYKGIYHERTVAVKSFRGKTITEIRRVRRVYLGPKSKFLTS